MHLGAEGRESNLNVCGERTMWAHSAFQKRDRNLKVREQGWKRSSNVLLLIIVTGTLDNPIMVKSFGDEQYAGCTGYPVDSHVVIWLTVCPPSLSHLFLVSELPFPPTEISQNLTLLPCPITDVPRPPHRTMPRMRQCPQNGIHRPTR